MEREALRLSLLKLKACRAQVAASRVAGAAGIHVYQDTFFQTSSTFFSDGVLITA